MTTSVSSRRYLRGLFEGANLVPEWNDGSEDIKSPLYSTVAVLDPENPVLEEIVWVTRVTGFQTLTEQTFERIYDVEEETVYEFDVLLYVKMEKYIDRLEEAFVAMMCNQTRARITGGPEVSWDMDLKRHVVAWEVQCDAL